MNYLIEIKGNSNGCSVVPTVGRSYTSKMVGEYFVDMSLIEARGFDGFLHLPLGGITVNTVAFGMKTYVQVEKPYPWSKHELVANVPIKEYCSIGYFKAFYRVVKGWLLA